MTRGRGLDIVRLVGENIRPLMLKGWRPNCCVATARVASLVLAWFDLRADVYPCAVVGVNKSYREAVEGGATPPEPGPAFSEWCELTGAYTVGAVPGGVPVAEGRRAFNGHCVVLVTVPGGLVLLLDGAAGLFSRPERGLTLPDSLIANLSSREVETFLTSSPLVLPVSGGALMYTRIGDYSWQAGSDWQDMTRTGPVVRELVRTVKAGIYGRA